MVKKPFFKFLCTFTLIIYGSVTAQAGQVITAKEREWAKQALSQEAQLDVLSSKSVAVLNFHNLTAQQQYDALQKGLAFMLITDLSKIEDLTVLERIKIQALLDEMKLGETGLVDTATAPQVGKLLKAYYVVNGDIQEQGLGELTIGSSLLDVPFENITDLTPAYGHLDELFRMEKEILFNIIEELNLFISPEKRKELDTPLSLSAAALLALFLGVDYSDKGMYEQAAEKYGQALTEDPALQAAQDSLQELKDMGLISTEDLSRVQPAPEEAVVETSSGLGTGVAVALGIAAIAGVAALAGSSSGTDEPNPSPPPTPGPTPPPPTPELDTTPPSVRKAGEKNYILCGGDTISFVFDEPVNRSHRGIFIDPEEYFTWEDDWSSDNTILDVHLTPTAAADYASGGCYFEGESGSEFNTFRITISGYADFANPPNAMGDNEFSFAARPGS